jgi:hypothetical protein
MVLCGLYGSVYSCAISINFYYPHDITEILLKVKHHKPKPSICTAIFLIYLPWYHIVKKRYTFKKQNAICMFSLAEKK